MSVWGLRLSLLLLVLGSAPSTSWAQAETVTIIVVKEHGVSAASYAQPYVDKFAERAAEANDWPGVKGVYLTNRREAEAFLQTNQPQYGIFSLPAFLALRQKYQLHVVGQVSATLVGGRQYFLISSTVSDLQGCKGKALATDHADDPRFVDRVIGGRQFTLKDFQLLGTQRPLQTIRKVIGGEAVCALVDDAQLAELAHIEGADAVHPVWKSAALAPMPVVAFPKTSEAERKRFQDNLVKLCDDGAKAICEEVGIQSLRTATDKDYAPLASAYGD